jgi:hypothetical protein
MTKYRGRFPQRFPVGTKYVVESWPGDDGQRQVFSRHLEFPDGTLFVLSATQTLPIGRAAIGRRRRPGLRRALSIRPVAAE